MDNKRQHNRQHNRKHNNKPHFERREEGFKPFQQFGPLFEKLKVRLVAQEELKKIYRARETAAVNEKKRVDQKQQEK